nr:thromboxane-A synthase-like [Rhipicephalus microplus]
MAVVWEIVKPVRRQPPLRDRSYDEHKAKCMAAVLPSVEASMREKDACRIVMEATNMSSAAFWTVTQVRRCIADSVMFPDAEEEQLDLESKRALCLREALPDTPEAERAVAFRRAAQEANALTKRHTDLRQKNSLAPAAGTLRNMNTRPLTTLEVSNCATTIFVAGNETIASALSYLTFVLTKYPDLEDKVRQEVVDTFSDQDKLEFETLMKRLNYLEQVISETLRLYPPGLTFVTRQANEDFAHKGTLFKAGTCFMVPLYQIQRDPRFWPDPLQFNPDRFAPENEAQLVKAAYMPFGVGQRNCVGKSMAMLTLKLAMAKLLLKYHLELGPSQKGEMQISSRAMVSTPTRGPWIIIRHINGHL